MSEHMSSIILIVIAIKIGSQNHNLSFIYSLVTRIIYREVGQSFIFGRLVCYLIDWVDSLFFKLVVVNYIFLCFFTWSFVFFTCDPSKHDYFLFFCFFLIFFVFFVTKVTFFFFFNISFIYFLEYF